eukprot:PITA_30643
MQGIHPSTCIHHIYTDDKLKPVRQPQRRMNPMMKEIVKEELQKLLNVGFIYPISDSQWVSPLVIVPKKNGKWRVCVDYRELNKATLKDHFPLPFIDQVLDSLAGKKYFSFLDGFSGYNQIRIATEDQDKTMFTCPWGTYAYKVFPFGLCNAPANFQRVVIAIFADLIHECVEVYMDDFTVYGNTYDDCLNNLEKVLKRCIETNLSLNIANYLSSGKFPTQFTSKQRKKIVRESSRYSWVNSDLFYTGSDLMIRKCVREDEILDILRSCHDEPCGGHFADKRTAYKVLQLGYYWPYVFRDSKAYVKQCGSCQRTGRPILSDEMSLKPQVLIEPFEQWALDFVGPINPPSNGKRYILVCTDYVTKWAEAKAVSRATEDTVVTFLFEEIFVRYGVPRQIITDQGTQFTSNLVQDLIEKYKIKHRKSTPYHPQANGQVESTNKVLENIMTKTVQLNRKDWSEKLKDALWAYRITWKNTTGFIPYHLVYGKEALLPIEFQIQTYRLAAELGMDLTEAQ